MTAEDLAREFHEEYERLAPQFGYKTRSASAKPWDDVPDTNKVLMIAVCQQVMIPKIESLQKLNAELLAALNVAEVYCPLGSIARQMCTSLGDRAEASAKGGA